MEGELAILPNPEPIWRRAARCFALRGFRAYIGKVHGIFSSLRAYISRKRAIFDDSHFTLLGRSSKSPSPGEGKSSEFFQALKPIMGGRGGKPLDASLF